MDKRYQVFISSTYADLAIERRQVIQTVIELDCIPAGMELFPAADQEQVEFIKRVIDDCDYYLLIIGGRYGSTDESGISYTEQEYDYAINSGLKVIALLHENPDIIPLGKSEKEPALRERLQQFRDKVASGRLVKFWKTAEELPGIVALSLSNTIKRFPAVGWVRANQVANEEALGELNNLMKENAQLKATVTKLSGASQPHITNLAGLNEKFMLGGRYYSDFYRRRASWSVDLTWREIFGFVSPYLVEHPNNESVKSILALAAFDRYHDGGSSPELEDQFFRTVAVQLKALGLVNVEWSEAIGGGMGLFWSLTALGERLMIELRTVRSKAASEGISPT